MLKTNPLLEYNIFFLISHQIVFTFDLKYNINFWQFLTNTF